MGEKEKMKSDLSEEESNDPKQKENDTIVSKSKEKPKEEKDEFKPVYAVQLIADKDLNIMLQYEDVKFQMKDGTVLDLSTPDTIARIMLSEMNTRLIQTNMINQLLEAMVPQVEQAVGTTLVKGFVAVKDNSGKDVQIPVANFLAQVTANVLLKLVNESQQTQGILTKIHQGNGKIIS